MHGANLKNDEVKFGSRNYIHYKTYKFYDLDLKVMTCNKLGQIFTIEQEIKTNIRKVTN